VVVAVTAAWDGAAFRSRALPPRSPDSVGEAEEISGQRDARGARRRRGDSAGEEDMAVDPRRSDQLAAAGWRITQAGRLLMTGLSIESARRPCSAQSRFANNHGAQRARATAALSSARDLSRSYTVATPWSPPRGRSERHAHKTSQLERGRDARLCALLIWRRVWGARARTALHGPPPTIAETYFEPIEPHRDANERLPAAARMVGLGGDIADPSVFQHRCAEKSRYGLLLAPGGHLHSRTANSGAATGYSAAPRHSG